MKNRLVVVLCFAYLLFVSASMYKVSSEENNALKVSNDLEATLSKLSPNDTLLLWVDVYIPPLPDGNIYLRSSDFSPVKDIGAKIAGVTFSSDKQQLWYLVEARTAQVSSLASLSMVRKVSLATIDVWDWWDKKWRNETPIDPFLNITMQRVNRDVPNSKVPVVINYASVEQNKTKESKVGRSEIIGEITALVESVGGEVVRVGIAEYILANVPPTALSRLTENKHVRTLEADKPAYLRGASFRKSMSNSQSQLLMLLLPLCSVCYVIRKPRKVKLTLIISLLLVTSFLLSYSVPSTYALNVSRPAIRADQTGYTGNGVVVAVIDSGIDFNHGDLVTAILADVDLTGNNDPMDYDGHGTHVAGIVASRSGTRTGIAPGSRIISLKIDTSARIRDAIQWCIDNRVLFNIRAIQLSWGDPTEQPGDGTDPLSMIADDAVEAGIAVVVAVMDWDTNWNGIYELSNPEQAFNVIAVGAVNDQNTVDINDDTVAYYSAGNSTTDGRPKPDVVAPGDRTDDPMVGIWSTRSAQAPAGNYEAISGVYGRMSGTSMAAPHVSGTVALMLEANPDLTPAQVKAILRQTARLNNNLNGDERAGHGIIDALAAVQLAQNTANVDMYQMYDSFDVETPGRHFDPLVKSWDYLTFRVNGPSSLFGTSLGQMDYHWRDWWGAVTTDYRLIHKIGAQHVWIDDTYYNLASGMNDYLFSGPRIYDEGSGYVRMRAFYRVNNVFVEYLWKLHVDEMYLWLYYSGGSSWKTLIYIDMDVWGTTNYAYLPSTSETVYHERKVTGAVLLDVGDLDHSEYIEIDPFSLDNPIMWTLRYGYTGNNPDTALDGQYICDRDIVVYYQGTSSYPGGWIDRKTSGLPKPRPTLTVQADYGGTTSPSPGSYTYDLGTSVTVKAYPSTNYRFDYWTLDGAIYSYSTSTTVTMDAPHTLKAWFSYIYSGCVAEGTLVTMADGTSKPVEEIKKGDQVLGFDPTTGSYVAENVLDVTKTNVEIMVYLNNGMLKLTPTDQPIFIRNATYEGWVRDPATIEVGWEIFNATSGSWVPVTSITIEEGKTRVYDLTLDGYTTYIANSILLMDKC